MIRRLSLILGLIVGAVCVLSLAYQAPAHGLIRTAGLGDQWFVRTTEAQRTWASTDGYVYPDELDAQGARFRWTRGRTLVHIPAIGATALQVAISAEGWPTDVLRSDLKQPSVFVLANGRTVGVFTPTTQLATFAFPVDLRSSDLLLDLRLSESPLVLPEPAATAIFTGTQQYPDDLRPHGLRLYSVELRTQGGGVRPARAILLGGAALIVLLGLTTWPARRVLLAALGVAGLLTLLVAWARLWAWPVLEALLLLALLLLLWNRRTLLTTWLGGLRWRLARSLALARGLALVSVVGLALALITWLDAPVRGWLDAPLLHPNTVMVISLGFALTSLLLIRWRDLSSWLGWANARIKLRRWPLLVVLTLVLLIWAGYMTSVIWHIPYLGNADYADNGVVARNLINGRGWVVDYVSQFYRLNPGGSVTRVQETWPLLQPVWIAPFFALTGVSAWAAKLPNLLFMALLALLVYHIGTRLWDRRVGLVAVILLLLNGLFVRLQIYSTSDLGFSLFYVAGLWTIWRAWNQTRRWPLVLSGSIIGLMCLQKPSGVLVAVGIGLWVLWQVWRRSERPWPHIQRLALYWVLPALLVFAPYVLRNMLEFGRPMFSTEQYDAWILEYPGPGDDWEKIYSVMTSEGGLPGLGLPDRSWVLRWGFQRTFDKAVRQVAAVRSYLLPASAGLGPLSGKGALLGNLDQGSSDPTHWLMVGSWLALIGLLLARRRQLRWLGLIFWSFAPYTLFLITYWHANEERYFVPLVPLLVLLAAAGLWAIHDSIARVARGWLRPLALVTLAALLVLAVQPGWVEIRDKISPSGEAADWQADLAAFAWLREHTPPDAVVMTRVPWQLNFHAERPAVMNPNTSDMATLLRIARYYNAQYLLVNALQNNKDDARIALGQLLQGQETAGFKRVAVFPAPKGRTIYIYAFPSDYNQVEPIVPAGASQR